MGEEAPGRQDQEGVHEQARHELPRHRGLRRGGREVPHRIRHRAYFLFLFLFHVDF